MFVHLREEKMIFVESNGLYEALKSKTSFIVDFYTTDQDIKLQSKIIKLKVKSRYKHCTCYKDTNMVAFSS